jgi:glycosyltransferase
MKNAYIFDEYVSSQQNGIGTFLGEFIYCLRNIEVNVHLIIFNSTSQEFNIIQDGGVRKIYFPAFPAKSFFFYANIVVRFLQLYIKDVVGNMFFINHSPCAALLKQIKLSYPLSKLIFTIHDFGWTSPISVLGDSNKFKKILSQRSLFRIQEKYGYILDYYDEERIMYDIVDALICLSEDAYSLLVDAYFISKEKIHLIPNGLRNTTPCLTRKEVIRKSKYIMPDEKILLFVGRVSKSKGIYPLLSSFKAVLKVYPNSWLVIAGFTREIRMILLASKNIASRIVYLGQVTHKELEKWYQVADLGVIPSWNEQCSYVGIEMMMHGMPIVASDGFGLKNMCQDGLNAITAKIGDRKKKREYVNNLTKAILSVLSSKDLQKKLKKSAYRTYQEKYSIDCMKKNYAKLIVSL